MTARKLPRYVSTRYYRNYENLCVRWLIAQEEICFCCDFLVIYNCSAREDSLPHVMASFRACTFWRNAALGREKEHLDSTKGRSTKIINYLRFLLRLLTRARADESICLFIIHCTILLIISLNNISHETVVSVYGISLILYFLFCIAIPSLISSTRDTK